MKLTIQLELNIMVVLSENAKDVIKKKTSPKEYIRITVAPGGCAGMTYDAVIVDEIKASERLVQDNDGIKIISDDASIPYMDGLEIDYSDDLISAGFRFNNARNETSCGCGASFTVAGFPQFISGGESCGS